MTNAREVKLAVVVLIGVLLATAASAQTNFMGRDPHNAPPANARAASAPVSGLGMALLAAFVSSNGNLITGAGATNSFLIGSTTSSYEIDFNRDVSNCFYQVSSYFSGYNLMVEPRTQVPNSVYVYSSYSGVATTDAFYLTVFCAN